MTDRDTCYLMYYEGPVFVDAEDSVDYEVFAMMESDVHEEGNAPADMTNGKPFFIGNEYGKGRVFSSIAHRGYSRHALDDSAHGSLNAPQGLSGLFGKCGPPGLVRT